MFKRVLLFASLLDIRELFRHLLLVQMEGTLLLLVSGLSDVASNLLKVYQGEDLAINLWDLGSGRRIKKMTGHIASIYSLAFSAESSLLVSSGADWTVRCWDVKGAGGTQEKPHTNGTTNGAGQKESHPKERSQESRETWVIVHS
jgi:WD40 repeat protein